MPEINWKTVDAILELDPQNQTVINFLVNCIRNEENDWDARNCLEKIGQGNKYVIDSLLKVFREQIELPQTSKLLNTIDLLIKIAPNNNDDFITILSIWLKKQTEIKPFTDFSISQIFRFYKLLIPIIPENPDLIDLLSAWFDKQDEDKDKKWKIKAFINRVIYDFFNKDKSIKWLDNRNKSLGYDCYKNLELKNILEKAPTLKLLLSNELIDLIQTETVENDKKTLIENSLSIICPEHPIILEHYLTLENEQESNENKSEENWISGYRLSDWLENVNPNYEYNQEIARIVISWMQTLTSEDKFYRCEKIFQWLGKVNFTDELLKNEVVDTLIYLLDTFHETSSNESDYHLFLDFLEAILDCLGEVAYGNQKAIDYLVNWINNPDTRKKINAIKNLAKITTENNNKSGAINAVISFIREEKSYQLDITLNALVTIDINNNEVIDFLLSSIKPDGILRYYREKVFDVISQIELDNNYTIDRLIKLTYDEYNNFDHRHQKKEFYQGLIGTLAKITTRENQLVNKVIETIFWWINQYLKENSRWEGELSKWSIEIESLASFAPLNKRFIKDFTSFLLKLNPNDFFWPTDFFIAGFSKEIQEDKIVTNNLIVIGKDEPQVIRTFGELIKRIKFYNHDDYNNICNRFLDLLLVIDTEKKITLEILMDLFNNYNHPPFHSPLALSSFVIDSLHKFEQENENEDLLRSLASALTHREENWSHENKTICKYLEKSPLGIKIAVETLSPALQRQTDYKYKYNVMIAWLIEVAPAESLVIDLLYYWLDSPSMMLNYMNSQKSTEETAERVNDEKERLRELWIKNASKYKEMAIQNLENRLQVLENNFQTIESALLLFQVDPNNEKALETILFLMENSGAGTEDENMTKAIVLDRLITILERFNKKDILKNTMLPNQLEKIVRVISQLLNGFSVENYEDQETYYEYKNIYQQMLWYCTQNLSYPKFYRAYQWAAVSTAEV